MILTRFTGPNATKSLRSASSEVLELRFPTKMFFIECLLGELFMAETPEAIRLLESRAGSAYWSAWRTLPISFPRNDITRVPDHWCTFGTRISPLSGSPRLAANPANAILNYLYALLESESRLA